MNHTSAVAVNSDREFLSQLKGWLAERGVSAVCTSSATSALDIVEQNQDVNLVITDTDLDDHSGLVLIEKMNSVLAPRRISTIFVSGRASLELAVSAMRLGASDFLARPVDLSKLSEAIERALERAERTLRIDSFICDAAAQVRLLVDLRNDRRSLLPEIPGGDTAWDMLLDVALAHISQRSLTVSALCAGADASTATALRRIEALEGMGLVERVQDLEDRRRIWVRITGKGEAAVRRVGGRLAASLQALL